MQAQATTKHIIKILGTSLVLILGLESCSLTTLPKDVKTSINDTNKQIDAAQKKIQNQHNQANENFNYDMKSVYISDVVVDRKDTDFLPLKFSDQVKIDATFKSMNEVANALNRITKYPVLVDVKTDNKTNVRITQHSGNLVDLLNNIAAKTDTAWSFRDGKIVLSETETRTWPVRGIASNVQVQNQVNSNSGIQTSGSGGSGGSSGGGANGNQNTVQNIQFNMTNSIWDNLNTTVKSMLSSKGNISINPATATLTVTDKPSVLLRVDNYIKQQNDILKRQVQIDVQVLSVQTDAADDYGINWNLVLKAGGGNLNINGMGGSAGDAAASAGNVFIPSSTTQAFTLGMPKGTGGDLGGLSGSSFIVQALSKIAKTSMITSVAATTLNNQPVPVQLVEQQSYLAGSTTTMGTGGAGNITTINTGQVTSGFVLNVLPVIEENGLVNLQVSMNLSELQKMSQMGTGANTVQLPDIIQRNTMQKTTIKSGETFVITGFDKDDAQVTHTGVGSAFNWLLGGGVSAHKVKTKLVILVTPRIVNM